MERCSVMIIKILLAICAVTLLENAESEAVETCMSTKINIKNNVKLEFCGSWTCENDTSFVSKLVKCIKTEVIFLLSGI